MQPPKPIKKFRGLIPWLNALRTWTISIQPLRSETCQVSQADNGRQILPSPAPAGGAAGSPSRVPLQPVDASVADEPAVTITPGTFGANVGSDGSAGIPTVAGTQINDTPAPRLVLDSGARTIYLQADIDTDANQVTGTSIHSTNDLSPPSNTDDTMYVALASVTVALVDSVASVQVSSPFLRGSQAYQRCGTTHLNGLI